MEGSGGAAFFIIDSGEAKVSSKGVILATLGPGEHFGEVALIDGGPRSATVTAATDLVCYGLTFWEFRPLVERNGTIGWRLLQALAKQLRDAVSARTETSLGSAFSSGCRRVATPVRQTSIYLMFTNLAPAEFGYMLMTPSPRSQQVASLV